MTDLSTDLAPSNPKSLRLRNPVMTASGTFGYGIEFAKLLDVQRLGAIICKGTTLRPRRGNPQPRLVETTAGLLNAIGLQNIGVKALIREKAPIWATWEVPVIVNVAGETLEEYVAVAGSLEGVAGVSGIELNISCPNVARGGAAFGSDCKTAAEVTAAVRAVTTLPLVVKLTPNVVNIGEIAAAVCEAGADAVSLINTLVGLRIDIRARRPLLGNITGGLSGPAVKPVALRLVYEVARAVDKPVVGVGGICTAADALEFIMAGASAVQVGTANFVNPRASLDVLDGIVEFMEREGVRHIGELIGVAQVPQEERIV